MKLPEILKYNGALFLTGLFFVFISATTAGLLLMHGSSDVSLFIWSGGAMFLGGAIGLYAVKDYRGRADFVPDYFIMLLPVTALVVVFSALYAELRTMHSWHALIWGFSVGICFGMLQAANPDSRRKGFPTFSLGAFAGGLLSMPVLSGRWHLSDIYAVTGCVVALMPLICFSGKLKNRRMAAVSILLGLGICAVVVHEAWRYRKIERHRVALQEEFRPGKTPGAVRSIPAEITHMLPVLLQPNAASLKILISEPSGAPLARQLTKMPFVGEVIRTGIDRVYRYNEPFAWHSGLRRALTAAVAERYLSGDNGVSLFNVMMVLPDCRDKIRERRFYTSEFYRIAADFLGPNGVLVTTVRSPEEAAAVCRSMKKSFASTAVFPGRNQDEVVVAAAGFELCTDYNELDRRAVLRLEHLGFCRGMMTVFLPPIRQYGLANAVAALEPRAVDNSDLRPCPTMTAGMVGRDMSRLWWLLPVVPLYWLLRFFLSRRITRRIAFSSWENGLYCGGFMTAVWLIFQGIEGRLFLYLGWLAAIFLLGAASAYGLRLHNRVVRMVMFVLSALLPFTLLYYDHILFQEYYLAICSLYMFGAGFAAGVAAAMFASRLPDGVYHSYLYWTIGAIPVGGLITWFMLASPVGGLWIWGGGMFLLRLPLIFRRLK